MAEKYRSRETDDSQGEDYAEVEDTGRSDRQDRVARGVLRESIQRRREETRSEAPETDAWMENAKDTTVTVLKGVWKGIAPARGIIALAVYIVWESLKEIKEDFKEKIINPLLKKAGLGQLKIKKGEKKEDK